MVRARLSLALWCILPMGAPRNCGAPNGSANALRHHKLPGTPLTDIHQTTRLRVFLGLLQGGLLYGLYQSAQANTWPATQPLLFGPALLLSVFVPLLGISAWGRMSRQAWLQWLAVALVLVAALGVYDLWRMNPLGEGWRHHSGQQSFPSVQAWVFFSAGLFMAHALVLSSAQDGHRVAHYTTYFDQSWKLFIQHVFSGVFVGALWLMLYLGAALFGLIGLKFLDRLLRESWFAIPVTTFATAWALHLTDVKPDIVRGIRGLILVLLSWILPVIAVLTTGFLMSLPFTGLQTLWGTRNATAVLLCAAAALVILINTAFQNGERSEQVNRAVRAFASLGCLLLLPIVGLATYGLSQRVGQYGWSGDRVIATACLVVASCYALGYGWAALPRGQAWLSPVAQVNVAVAWVILAVLLALFSPLADPSRLAVNDQLARLRDGRTTAELFDYHYLRFEAGRHGYNALKAMAEATTSGAQAQLTVRYAKAALQSNERGMRERKNIALDAQGVRDNIKAVWPKGAQLPATFLEARWLSAHDDARDWRLPECLTRVGVSCEAVLLQLDTNKVPQVLIIQPQAPSRAVVLDQDDQHQWRVLSTLPTRVATCETERERLRTGQFSYVAPRTKNLQLGDWQVAVQPDQDRTGKPAASSEAGCR
jgi:hypothetical protein